MALTISEKADSLKLVEVVRDGALENRLTRRFVISGSDDSTDPAVRSLSPLIGDGYLSGSPPVNALNLYCIQREYEVRKTGSAGIIELHAIYGPPWRLPDNNSGTPETEFMIQTESVHLQNAIAQTHYPSTASDVGLAVNVTDSGVLGVDVLKPKAVLIQNILLDSFSGTYQLALMNLVGKTNSGTFKGWAAGTLLFLGVSAKQKGNGPWQCKFYFGLQLSSTTSYATLSGTQSVTRNGWDYVWQRQASQDDGTGAAIVIGTESVHVAQVYDSADFSTIGI